MVIPQRFSFRGECTKQAFLQDRSAHQRTDDSKPEAQDEATHQPDIPHSLPCRIRCDARVERVIRIRRLALCTAVNTVLLLRRITLPRLLGQVCLSDE